MHQGVYLQLGVVEGLGVGLLHPPVDHLSDSRIQADLLGRQDGDVILIDHACLLFHKMLAVVLLQLLAGQPEEHVLLAVLGAQKLAEHIAPGWVLHQLLEGVAPAVYLF